MGSQLGSRIILPPLGTEYPYLRFTWDCPFQMCCRINLYPEIGGSDKCISMGTLTYQKNSQTEYYVDEILYIETDKYKCFSNHPHYRRDPRDPPIPYDPHEPDPDDPQDVNIGITLWSDALTKNNIKWVTELDKTNLVNYIQFQFGDYMKRSLKKSSLKPKSGSSGWTKTTTTNGAGGGKSKHIKTTRQTSKGNIIYTKDGKEYVKRLNKKTRKYEFKKKN
jgi:hypothetical protein